MNLGQSQKVPKILIKYIILLIQSWSNVQIFLARRRGLLVRVKIHDQEVVRSNPGTAVEAIFHAPFIWIKSMKA
jgi:hypothetical protein